MDMELVISSPPVSMSVTVEGLKHTLTVHEAALKRIPYFKESSWCAGKKDLDITLPAGTGIEAMRCLLARCYGLQLPRPSVTLACQMLLLSEFFLMHEDRVAILDLLKSTLVSPKDLDEACEFFKEKEVPQALQHILRKAASSVDSLVVDVAHWGEASVKAMLQTCVDSISTIPEDLDPEKPKKPSCASSLYYESNGHQKGWADLPPEEKTKWEREVEMLQKSFQDREKSWQERRQIQARHLEKVLEFFDRRISRGLVKTDIAILLSMLAGSPPSRLRAYFIRDETVKTGKPSSPANADEEYQWKYWNYSLQPGFESLGAVASAMIKACPDFWAVFVFDLVAGLPTSAKAHSRKNHDGSFTFTTVGVTLDGGFWQRLDKMLEAVLDLGVRLLKEGRLQPVQLITGLSALIFSIEGYEYDGVVPFWLGSAFGRVAAALDLDARALLLDSLLGAQLPQSVETCWAQTTRNSMHPPPELPRLSTLRRSIPLKDRAPVIEQLMPEVEVFALFADAGKEQICHLLMHGHDDHDSFLFWASSSMLQAMSLELQVSCINWLGAHVIDLVQNDHLDMIDAWLDAFKDSPKLLQSLAVLLMPIFPHIFAADESWYDYLHELAYPDSAAGSGAVASTQEEVQRSAAESTEPTQEPDLKRSRLE